MIRRVKIDALLLMVLLGMLGILQGCGSGSDSGSTTTGTVTSGISLPTEVSAISANNTSGAASLASQVRAVAAAVGDLPATSDYQTTLTSRYVDEPILEVFGIIETILKATAQTHYGDTANVGSGPYKAVVAWFDDEGGKATKTLEDWVVKSDMVGGVNQVRVWIDDDQEPVKVQVDISAPPTQAADGSYLNYGEWTILADIGNGGSDGGTFYAKAEIVGGQTQLSMSEDFTHTENMGGGPVAITQQTKAIMLKSNLNGVGKASIADYGYCWDTGGGPSPCTSDLTLPTVDVQYAYNADTLAIDPGGSDPIVYKDRTNPVEINYRYGLFDAATGQDVEKAKQFGFPITFDSDGSHGYYGAWQGRHQLWAGDAAAPADGTSVTKEVWDDSVAPTYTTKTYNGSLTKRGLVAGDLAQIQDIPVEIWMSDNFDLKFDSTLNSGAGGWKKCAFEITGVDGSGYDIWQESCSSSVFDLSTLVNSQDSRKHINIGGYICASYGPDTACNYPQFDFMQAGYFQENQYSQFPDTQYGSGLWKNGDRLWINVNGSTYIVYNGTAWIEKTLAGFDDQTWTPTFADGGDIAFDFPADREYYINNKGANFVVKRIASNGDSGDYEVKMEVQSVVRPDNVATVLSGVSYFAFEWEDASTRSTFSFDPATLLLKFLTVGDNDAGASIGDTLTQGSWGLVAFDDNGTVADNSDDVKLTNGDGSSLQFNWEYATQENPWGAITYLLDGNGDPVYLSDPIMLDPLALTPLGGGAALNYSLQFDGWMHGLPDMHWELEKNNFILNDNIKNKVVNIPAATEVTDSLGTSYYIKPLEVGVILPILGSAPVGAPDPADAVSLDLNFTVPVPADIGTMPTGVVTKYVEGVAVQ